MKQAHIIGVFFATHVLFVLLLIYKQSYYIKLSYYKQKLENTSLQLAQHKHALTHQLYQFYDRATIKQVATNQLSLQPIKVTQVRKASHESPV